MPGGGRVALRFLAARLGVDERCAREVAGVRLFDLRSLQYMQAAALWLLRIGGRQLQALDAQLEEQLVLIGERVVGEGIALARRQGHPVVGVIGEKLVPLIEALLIEKPRLLIYEADDVRLEGVRGRLFSPVPHGHGAMNSRQARNWLRIEISLVPLQVISPSSPGWKLRCRLTHSLPSAASPSCAER